MITVHPLLDWNLVVWSWWCESEKRKEANIPWVMQLAFTVQGISQKQRERERQTDRQTDRHTGTQALMEQRCFNQHGVGIYTVFSSVQSFSSVWLFVIPWITACQAFLSITNSLSLLKLMPIQLVMPSSHLICRSLLILPPIPPSIRVFSNESTLHMR